MDCFAKISPPFPSSPSAAILNGFSLMPYFDSGLCCGCFKNKKQLPEHRGLRHAALCAFYL